MIIALSLALGVPLWLCAAAILVVLLRNRALRKRPGNVPVRIRRQGRKWWSPGHAVWIHDVFAFRGLAAAWKEALIWAGSASSRPAASEERRKLHRIGRSRHRPTHASGRLAIDVAARADREQDLFGPFAGAGEINRLKSL